MSAKFWLVATIALTGLSCQSRPHDVASNDAGTKGDEAGQPAASESAVTYHEHVQPLLATHCLRCHRDGPVSGVPLDSYEKAAAHAEVIAREVETRSMPPFRADNSGACNRFRTNLWLERDAVETLRSWADDGAPRGVTREPVPYVRPPRLDRVDLVLEPDEAFTPDDSRDRQFRCFVIEAKDLDRPRYVTALEAIPDHPEQVHHVVVYDLDPDAVSAVEELDEADPGPGYDCYGGPGVAFASVLGLWASGQGAVEFPEGTGILIEPNDEVVVQIDYETTGDVYPDRTKVHLELQDDVKPAFIAAIGDLGLGLRPGMIDAEGFHEEPHPMFAFPALTRLPLELHGVMPHMHQSGRTLKVEHFRGDDSACLLRVSDWELEWQRFYFFEQPLSSEPGDLFRISCRYDTTRRAEWVGWGPTETDEMCVALFYVTVDDDPSDTTAPSDVSESVVDLPGTDVVGEAPSKTHEVRVGRSIHDRGRGLAFDEKGNLYAAFMLRDPDPAFPTRGLETTGLVGELIKFGPYGEVAWTFHVDGPGDDDLDSVVPSSDDTLLVSGAYEDRAALGDVILPEAADRDMFLARLSTDGEVVWSRSFGGAGDDHAKASALVEDEARGTIWMLAIIEATMTFAGRDLVTDGIGQTPALLKFDADGTELWGTTFPVTEPVEFVTNPRRARIHALATDAAGNVYFAGFFRGTIHLPGGEVRTSAGFADGIVGSLSPTGALRWAHRMGGSNEDEFKRLRLDSNNLLHVSGKVTGPARLGGLAGEHGGGQDAVWIGVSTSGDALWLRQYGGPHHEWFAETAGLADGSTLAFGLFVGAGDFGGGPLSNRGAIDAALVGLAPDGTHLFSKRFGSPGRDTGHWIAVHQSRIALYWTPATPVETPGARLVVLDLSE